MYRILFLALILGVSGCQNYDSFVSLYNQGAYLQASESLGGEKALDQDSDLLTGLYLGSAFRAQGLFNASTQAFDQAEQHLLWKHDGIQNLSDLIDSGIGFFISEAATSYQGQIYEGVLLNTYKALNHLQSHNFDQARIEFNRATQRQENAVTQLQEKLDALEQTDTSPQDQEILDHSHAEILEQNPTLQTRLQAIQSLTTQKNLRNPFTDYWHGIFRLIDNDSNRASDLLRNATVLSQNSYVLEDFALAERSASSSLPPDFQRLWVLYEDGTGPYLTAYDVGYDLFSFELEEYLFVSFSVPEFNHGFPAWDTLTIHSHDQTYHTQTLLDLNQYAQTEFDLAYPTILKKAIASSVFKTLAQVTGSALTQDSDPLTPNIRDRHPSV